MRILRKRFPINKNNKNFKKQHVMTSTLKKMKNSWLVYFGNLPSLKVSFSR